MESLYSSDFICLVETWATENLRAIGRISEFEVFELLADKIHLKGRGSGGLAILMKKKKFSKVEIVSTPNYQIISQKVYVGK